MEWFVTKDGKYRIESLSASTVPGALQVIRESFCQDEAVCIGAGVNKNPLAAEELLELCADAALDGASLVAVVVDSGDVVAASFNKIQVAASDSSEKPFFEVFAEERCSQESAKSLIQFMANVDGRCNLFQKYGVDCSLEIMFLATLREHRKQRLGEFLCKFSIELAKELKNGPVAEITVEDLGPKYSSMKSRSAITAYPKICQAIWTAEPTAKIGRRLEFTEHLVVSFSEFVYDSKTYTERIGTDGAECIVAAQPLY
ncbi:unnamed protein product [Chilo suppressalis]|uniref:N-acetyltransferase domain-containing protein n=1 Tax=Chilo suppressalis TaxID=168631 RepID=A0ABN8AW06_CHISP|nr:hypothetical protein evm_001209 [Chilo suppressalis]CAH0398677.1 unnamed protein product [Chilo suppressalis]